MTTNLLSDTLPCPEHSTLLCSKIFSRKDAFSQDNEVLEMLMDYL